MCTFSNTLPSNQSNDALTTTAAPERITPSRKRSVRFGEHTDDDNLSSSASSYSRPIKRRIVELFDVPISSQMTDEERSTRWMQQSDHRATYSDVAEVVRTCQASGHHDNHDDVAASCASTTCNGKSSKTPDAYVNFAEALATAYNICCESIDDSCHCDSWTNTTNTNNNEASEKLQLPMDQMIVFGSSHTQSRGLESKIIPGLGGHRYKKRKEHIIGVLSVQRELRAIETNESDMAEGLGAVSEYLSRPSARFARTLGSVDGTMALLEYAAAQSSQMEETQTSCISAFLSMQALDSIVA